MPPCTVIPELVYDDVIEAIGWLCDAFGLVERKLRTTRGLPPQAWIKKIDFTSSRVGWAVFYGLGTHTNLFRTTDGGVHWTQAGPLARRHTHR